MFSNEIEASYTITTLMDETAEHEDVQVIIDDECVMIRQWNEDVMAYDLITMSHNMYFEMIESRKQPAGFFVFETKK